MFGTDVRHWVIAHDNMTEVPAVMKVAVPPASRGCAVLAAEPTSVMPRYTPCSEVDAFLPPSDACWPRLILL
jgi:hypothetical protein